MLDNQLSLNNFPKYADQKIVWKKQRRQNLETFIEDKT